MNLTPKDIDAIGSKNIVWLWPITMKEEVQAILSESNHAAVFATISLQSLATILFSYLDKMSSSEAIIFESICSYFSGPYADLKWLTTEDGEGHYLVFDFQPFFNLLEKSWAQFPIQEHRDPKYSEVAEAVAFLLSNSLKSKNILLELVWGR